MHRQIKERSITMQVFIISERNCFANKIVFIATSKSRAVARLKRLYKLDKSAIESLFQRGNYGVSTDFTLELDAKETNKAYAGFSSVSQAEEIVTLEPAEIFHRAAAGEINGVLHFKDGTKVGSGIVRIGSDENGKRIYFAQEMYSERKYPMQEDKFVKFEPIG